MGLGGATYPPCQTRRRATDGQCARGLARHLLRAFDRLPVDALPSDLPPRSTVWDYLDLWEWDGTIERTHHALYVQSREQAGHEASPTTAIIDAQSAKGAVKGGARLIPVVMMRGRRSSAASATSSLTR